MGVKLPVEKVRVIRLASFDDAPESVSDAAAVEIGPGRGSTGVDAEILDEVVKAYRKAWPDVPVGMTVGPDHVAADMKVATDAGLDFVTLIAIEAANGDDASESVELNGRLRIDVLGEAMAALRAMKLEESIDIIYFGGIRGGSDLAKVLALCGNAVLIGQAALIAAGDCREQAAGAESAEGLSNFVQSMFMEASILARSCGKTDVHNLEPEDLRSLRVATSSATAIPLVGKDKLYTGNAVRARA